jgi:hypothetical protein
LQTGENDYGCKERARNPANIGMTSACVLYVATAHDGRRRRQPRAVLQRNWRNRGAVSGAPYFKLFPIGSRGGMRRFAAPERSIWEMSGYRQASKGGLRWRIWEEKPTGGIFRSQKDKKAGRGWHHHSRAPRRRSMGQGGRPAAGITPKTRTRSRSRKLFCTRLSDCWILNLQGSSAFK